MRDQYLPLVPGGTALTASATGTALDLLIGTNIARLNLAGTDLVGNMGSYAPIDAVIEVSGVTGTTPQAVFTLNQSDDNATFTPIGTTTATAAGGYRIGFTPTKRFVRLDTAVTGTAPTFTVDAYVGTREF